MFRKHAHTVVLLLGVLLVGMHLFAAAPVRRQTSRKQSDSRVYLLHADELFFNERISRTAQILRGHVRFRHDNVVLTCDSACYYEASNSFDAFGHVKMNQADTLTLTSDVLFYDGMDQMARARYNVVLTHYKKRREQTVLYCDSMDYDRLYDLGYFFNGGRLVDKDNVLTSEWGQYSPSTSEAVFNYNVDLQNPKFTLVSDTLHYNSNTSVAQIVGPSNIDNGDNHIYSERGFYDTQRDHAHLLERSIVNNKGKSITGDSLDYVGAGAISKAFGNVLYVDEVNKNMFRGHYAMYCDSIGYTEATDSAVCIDYSQRDTFYIHADTFKVFTYDLNTDSVWREVRAYNHVRAYRVDVQAVCDSMVYISRDSCLTMYKDPIIWQNGQQLLGEEIKAWNNDSTIDSTYVIRQALSVEKVDSMCFNQMSCNLMRSFFQDGQMKLTWAEGNVLVNYFPFDSDSLMIGMNHLETTHLKLFMNDEGRLARIWAAGGSGTLHPLALIPKNERYLEKFQWFDYIRPLNKDDIFQWRGKRAGSELKKSVRRQAPPKQKVKR